MARGFQKESQVTQKLQLPEDYTLRSNIGKFISVLRMASTPEVVRWTLRTAERAFGWATYVEHMARKSSLLERKDGERLLRIVDDFRCSSMLPIGISLGSLAHARRLLLRSLLHNCAAEHLRTWTREAYCRTGGLDDEGTPPLSSDGKPALALRDALRQDLEEDRAGDQRFQTLCRRAAKRSDELKAEGRTDDAARCRLTTANRRAAATELHAELVNACIASGAEAIEKSSQGALSLSSLAAQGDATAVETLCLVLLAPVSPPPAARIGLSGKRRSQMTVGVDPALGIAEPSDVESAGLEAIRAWSLEQPPLDELRFVAPHFQDLISSVCAGTSCEFGLSTGDGAAIERHRQADATVRAWALRQCIALQPQRELTFKLPSWLLADVAAANFGFAREYLGHLVLSGTWRRTATAREDAVRRIIALCDRSPHLGYFCREALRNSQQKFAADLVESLASWPRAQTLPRADLVSRDGGSGVDDDAVRRAIEEAVSTPQRKALCSAYLWRALWDLR